MLIITLMMALFKSSLSVSRDSVTVSLVLHLLLLLNPDCGGCLDAAQGN